MKRVSEEMNDDGAIMTPWTRTLVVRHGLLQGDLIGRWRFALKMSLVCRALRYSPLVMFAVSHYCAVFTTITDFEKFIHEDCDRFPHILQQIVGPHFWMEDIDTFQQMQSEWRTSVLKDKDPYIAGPGFKTADMVHSNLGLVFRHVQDMGFHKKGRGMDHHFGWKASSTMAGLAFMYTMLTESPGKPFFIIFPYFFYCHVDEKAEATFFSVLHPVSKHPYYWNQDIASACRMVLTRDHQVNTDLHERQLACFSASQLKEGTQLQRLGYFLRTWFAQLFEITQFE